jgi:hypothetical protein
MIFYFIHSSIDEYLCKFYILAIVDSAEIKMGMQIALLYVDLFPLDIYSGA